MNLINVFKQSILMFFLKEESFEAQKDITLKEAFISHLILTIFNSIIGYIIVMLAITFLGGLGWLPPIPNLSLIIGLVSLLLLLLVYIVMFISVLLIYFFYKLFGATGSIMENFKAILIVNVGSMLIFMVIGIFNLSLSIIPILGQILPFLIQIAFMILIFIVTIFALAEVNNINKTKSFLALFISSLFLMILSLVLFIFMILTLAYIGLI
jgi:hypothetical protein